jgi:tryptophan 2,3-dioxygenase
MSNRRSGMTLEPAEREVLMWQVFEMSSKRIRMSQIARDLNITPRTAKRLLADAAEAYRKENAHQGPMAVHTFEQLIRAAWAAWEEAYNDPDRRHWRELAPLARVIKEAQEQIVLIGGWRAPVQTNVSGKMEHNHKVLDYDNMSVEQLQEYHDFLDSLPVKEG